LVSDFPDGDVGTGKPLTFFTVCKIHIIGTERRTQIRPTRSLFGHGQNLGSTSGVPEFVAQQFFKIPDSGGLSRVTSQFLAGEMANIMLLVVRAYMC
jgi:hypothetical protein